MRYLTLGEALVIAEAVTGIDRTTLARTSRLELLDSAIHAPQGGFGDVALNGRDLQFDDADAIDMMLAVAAGDLDEAGVAQWLTDRLIAAE